MTTTTSAPPKDGLGLPAASRRSNERAHAALQALVIPIRKDATGVPVQKSVVDPERPGVSKELPEDPFTSMTSDGTIIEPPFDMLTLAMLPEHSTELGQCIEAMEVNIEAFGYRFVSRVKMEANDGDKEPPAKDELQKSVQREKVFLENFFKYVSLEDSFTGIRRKTRKDVETTGNGYWEVIRNPVTKKIQGFNHIPSYQMRLAVQDEDPTEAMVPILTMKEDNSVVVENVKTWKRFRRFVQSRAIFRRNLSALNGYKMRWFKEFGDPRVWNNETGELQKDDEKLPESKHANEIIHFKLYSARSPYGLPRYIGNLLTIFGDRAAEEINYVTFKNNNVPSMAILVSNGQLTEGSIERITSFVESQIQGSDNYSKFLVVEAEGLMEGEDSGNVKMEIKPLVKDQHTDALFQAYSKNNQDKMRRAFRLPPIYVGRAEDASKANAESARKLADVQVFGPERDEFDSMVNRRILPSLGVVYHTFKTNTPNTTDNQSLVQILAGAEKTGGMTPRIARKVIEDILGIELPPFPAKFGDMDFNPDLPFSLLMAEAVKNKADPAEPGQQVTALKSLNSLLGGILGSRDALEKAWTEENALAPHDHE
jgi:PBSX family phage portal protein